MEKLEIDFVNHQVFLFEMEIMPSQNKCGKCGEQYADYSSYWFNWCKSCQINSFKTNFTNWTSGNEKIDDIIQTLQLKINDLNDIVFEWIPYNKLDNIEEINKGDFATVYSAMWKNGPLCYNHYKMEYLRNLDKKVTLECLHNSQNITNEFLNKV